MHDLKKIEVRVATPIRDLLVSCSTFGAGIYGSDRSAIASAIAEECRTKINADAFWRCDPPHFVDGICTCGIGCTMLNGLYCHFNAILTEV